MALERHADERGSVNRGDALTVNMPPPPHTKAGGTGTSIHFRTTDGQDACFSPGVAPLDAVLTPRGARSSTSQPRRRCGEGSVWPAGAGDKKQN